MPRLRYRKDYNGLSELFRDTNKHATTEEQQHQDSASPSRSRLNVETDEQDTEISISNGLEKGYLSTTNILSKITNSDLVLKINNYKESLRLMEIELDNRTRTGRNVTSENQFNNARFRIGSLAFYPTQSGEMGARSQRAKTRFQGRSSLDLNISNKEYIKMLKKLKTFARSLNLTDEERVKLLSEWETLLL